MMMFVFPVRETIEVQLKFPGDLSADEVEDIEEYLTTFLTVEKRKAASTKVIPTRPTQ